MVRAPRRLRARQGGRYAALPARRQHRGNRCEGLDAPCDGLRARHRRGAFLPRPRRRRGPGRAAPTSRVGRASRRGAIVRGTRRVVGRKMRKSRGGCPLPWPRERGGLAVENSRAGRAIFLNRGIGGFAGCRREKPGAATARVSRQGARVGLPLSQRAVAAASRRASNASSSAGRALLDHRPLLPGRRAVGRGLAAAAAAEAADASDSE